MILSALTMMAMDLSALLKARLTAKKVNSVNRKSELKKANAFLPDFCYFIQWIGLNNQGQLFAAKGCDRVFSFGVLAFNQIDKPLRRLFLMVCWLIFMGNTDYFA